MKPLCLLPVLTACLLHASTRAQEPAPPHPIPASATPTPTPSPTGEVTGSATILPRAQVLRDRDQGQGQGQAKGKDKHLWPLLHTPEARMNYFEVAARVPLHFHPDADHRLYVLEGSLMVTCGTTTTKCSAGDFIIIPRGVRHSYDVAAPGEKALLLTFDAPPYDPKKTVSLEPRRPTEKK